MFIGWFAAVPIILAVTEGIEHPITLTPLNTANPIELQLPFKWQILWWGSLAYAIAYMIYQLRCPAFIKLYRSYGEYRKVEHSPRHIVWEASYAYPARNRDKYLHELVEKEFAIKSDNATISLTPSSDKQETVWQFVLNDSEYGLSSHNLHLDQEREKELFWIDFGEYARSYPLSRILVQILLYVAIISIAIVTIQSIEVVVSRLIGS